MYNKNLTIYLKRLVEHSSSFIESNSGGPFLLMLNFLHVHTPLFSSKQFKNKSVHGKYGDNVLELDWAVGQIYDKLASLNLLHNTLVYFSTDQAAHVEEVSQASKVRKKFVKKTFSAKKKSLFD